MSNGAERGAKQFRAAANGSEDSQPNLRLLNCPAAKKPHSPSFQACAFVQASFLAGNFSETTRGRLVGPHHAMPSSSISSLRFVWLLSHSYDGTTAPVGRATFGDKHWLSRRKEATPKHNSTWAQQKSEYSSEAWNRRRTLKGGFLLRIRHRTSR